MVKLIAFSLLVLGILAMTAVVSAYPSYSYLDDCGKPVFYKRADTSTMFGSYTLKTVYRESPKIIVKHQNYFIENADYPHYVMNRRSGKVYYTQRF